MLQQQQRNLKTLASQIYKQGRREDIIKYITYPDYVSYKEQALLYYIRLRQRGSGNCLYKIGFTVTNIETRINRMGVDKDYIVDVLQVLVGPSRVIYSIEQLFHKEFGKFIYGGKPILLNGNSEVYVKDVLGLGSEHYCKKFKLFKKDIL